MQEKSFIYTKNRWIKRAETILWETIEDRYAELFPSNKGTLMLDATCAPQNIAFPQDINLLNEARENLEAMIDTICYEYNETKPRTYRRKARNDYLALAKCRKRGGKRIRKAIKKQLQYIRRDLKYIDGFLDTGKHCLLNIKPGSM